MRNEIEYGADVRVNVSERRADFYRSLPGRIQVGYTEHATRNSDRKLLGFAIGLLLTYAAFLLR